jgi:hypothetical protein
MVHRPSTPSGWLAIMRHFELEDFESASSNPRQNHTKLNRKRVENGQDELPFGATPLELQALWIRQEGKCALCGIEMDLVGAAHVKWGTNSFRLSVDRIVPALLYTTGNIRLLHDVCNSFKKNLDDHMVYAVARGIVKTFEEKNPNLRVEISPDLVTRDGDKTFFHFPGFHVHGDTSKLVIPTASRDAFNLFADELLVRGGQMPEYHTPAEMIEKLKIMYPHIKFPTMEELAQILAQRPPEPQAATEENANG